MSPTETLMTAKPATTTYKVSGMIPLRSTGLRDAQNNKIVHAIINTAAQPIAKRNSFLTSENGIIAGGIAKRDYIIRKPIIPSRTPP